MRTQETKGGRELAVTIHLRRRQLADFDWLLIQMRFHGGMLFSRQELLRALVDVMEQTGIDFTDCTDSEAITAALTHYFRQRRDDVANATY